MTIHIAKPEHEVAYEDVVALISRQAAKVSAEELLAIAANMLGKLIALQDQRTMSPERAMQTVAKNIEVGNEQALKNLTVGVGGSA